MRSWWAGAPGRAADEDCLPLDCGANPVTTAVQVGRSLSSPIACRVDHHGCRHGLGRVNDSGPVARSDATLVTVTGIRCRLDGGRLAWTSSGTQAGGS